MFHRYRQRLFGVALGACLIAVTHVSAAITLDSSQRRRIDALFSELNSQTPGCALGIMSDGRMIYARGHGMATLEPPVANDSTRVFDIASISKHFTAASVVLLLLLGGFYSSIGTRISSAARSAAARCTARQTP